MLHVEMLSENALFFESSYYHIFKEAVITKYWQKTIHQKNSDVDNRTVLFNISL